MSETRPSPPSGEPARDAAHGTQRTAPRRSPWRWAVIAVLAVAAFAYAVVTFGPRETSWRLQLVQGQDGAVTWEGTRFAVTDSHALGAALRAGGSFHVEGDAALEIAHPGDVSFQFGPETKGQISAPPRRLSERRVAVRLERGAARLSTGVRFRGAQLDVETPETRIVVGGTTLCVLVTEEGTCASSLLGEARMQDRSGQMIVLAEGSRRFVYRDGRPPLVEALDDGERARLQDFLDRHRDIMHE